MPLRGMRFNAMRNRLIFAHRNFTAGEAGGYVSWLAVAAEFPSAAKPQANT
jgi:hypothetical protein